MRHIMLAAAAVVALTAGVAEARCSKEEGKRALQKLYSYLDQNPDKRSAALAHLNEIVNGLGGSVSEEQYCDIVNQVMVRMSEGGR